MSPSMPSQAEKLMACSRALTHIHLPIVARGFALSMGNGVQRVAFFRGRRDKTGLASNTFRLGHQLGPQLSTEQSAGVYM